MHPQIFDSLYQLHIPEKVFRYKDPTLLQDFSQFCYLQLLEVPPEKLNILLETGQLANYFFILCKRQITQGSRFWHQYRGKLNIQYYETLDDEQFKITDDSI